MIKKIFKIFYLISREKEIWQNKNFVPPTHQQQQQQFDDIRGSNDVVMGIVIPGINNKVSLNLNWMKKMCITIKQLPVINLKSFSLI